MQQQSDWSGAQPTVRGLMVQFGEKSGGRGRGGGGASLKDKSLPLLFPLFPATNFSEWEVKIIYALYHKLGSPYPPQKRHL